MSVFTYVTREQLGTFIGTRETVYMRTEFKSARISLGHHHGRRFIVFGTPSWPPFHCFWYTIMAAVSLFWDTNMAFVTSRENSFQTSLANMFYFPNRQEFISIFLLRLNFVIPEGCQQQRP